MGIPQAALTAKLNTKDIRLAVTFSRKVLIVEYAAMCLMFAATLQRLLHPRQTTGMSGAGHFVFGSPIGGHLAPGVWCMVCGRFCAHRQFLRDRRVLGWHATTLALACEANRSAQRSFIASFSKKCVFFCKFCPFENMTSNRGTVKNQKVPATCNSIHVLDRVGATPSSEEKMIEHQL